MKTKLIKTTYLHVATTHPTQGNITLCFYRQNSKIFFDSQRGERGIRLHNEIH